MGLKSVCLLYSALSLLSLPLPFRTHKSAHPSCAQPHLLCAHGPHSVLPVHSRRSTPLHSYSWGTATINFCKYNRVEVS